MSFSRFLWMLFCLIPFFVNCQERTIHVFVALCDNKHQGIVPVPEKLGNGKDPANNLYWGAVYGIKSYLKHNATEWKLIKTFPSENPKILERVLFKHQSKEIYMLADAYDGEEIKTCTEDFLLASNRQNPVQIRPDSLNLSFGGHANLIVYIGHNGLMDFFVDLEYQQTDSAKPEVFILACISKEYFKDELKLSGAKPILLTTNLMAPEAYTLKGAIDGWILNEEDAKIVERAAKAYNKYQKCGIKGAQRLFTSGID